MTADELRDALDQLDLTQTEAARRMRVSLRTVQTWVAGKHEIPGPAEVLVKTWLAHPETLPDEENSDE